MLPDELETWMACTGSAPRLAGTEGADGAAAADAARGVHRAVRAEALLAASSETHTHHDQTAHAIGFVSLVGAGPGDPDLLTRQAAERLAEADLVLYDALVDPRRSRWRRPRSGSSSASAPAAAGASGVHHPAAGARRAAGRRVVRLKGGDPFVFGRGGEEALALDGGRYSVRGRAGGQLGDRGAGAGRDPGDAPRRLRPASRSCRATPRRRTGRCSRASLRDSATVVVMMGLRTDRRDRAAPDRARLEPSTPSAVLLGASTPEAAA